MQAQHIHFELFQRAATINSEFEIIPNNIKLLAEGVVIDKNGYMQHKGKTYITNLVKLKDLPERLQYLFVEDHTKLQKYNQQVEADNKPATKKDSKMDKLNSILFVQLQNIVDPEKDTDMNKELKKANTVCNVADKIIKIADISLKAAKFNNQKLLA